MAREARRRDDVVAATAAKLYWREADARVVVDAWRRSGQSLLKFAAGLHVPRQRIARWADRLEASARETAGAGNVDGSRDGGNVERPSEVDFHPVRLVGAEPNVERSEPIEVVLGEGVRVRVPEGFASDHLSRVLAVLSERAAC